MTTISLSKACDNRRPVRRGEAPEGLSDASQWLLGRLLGWRPRSRGERMLRAIGVTRADALCPSSKQFWKE
jgi:hypothetical protein